MFRKGRNILNDYFFSHFAMTRGQRSGFLVLIILIIAAEAVIQFYPFRKTTEEIQKFTPEQEALALQLKAEETGSGNTRPNIPEEISAFNPNELDEEGFMSLGFSQKQAASLIKYRYSLGGNFSDVNEFRDAYVVSDWMFEKLQPHINLKPYSPNLVTKKKYGSFSSPVKPYSYEKKTIKPFYINRLNVAEIVELGFSEKQAQAILNFKNSLPGKRFASAEQFDECFVVNDYMFNRLKPYLRFEKAEDSANAEIQSAQADSAGKFNPNEMKQKDWESFGFNSETAKNIIKYREFVGGFKTPEDVRKCRYISETDFVRIKDKLVFN